MLSALHVLVLSKNITKLLQAYVQTSDQPNFGYGYGFSAETASKVSFGPVLVSAN